MKTIPYKDLIAILRTLKKAEQGEGISDGDKAFKRGYRTALRLVQEEVERAIGMREPE